MRSRKDYRMREMPGPDAGVTDHLRALPYFDPFEPDELEEIVRLCGFHDYEIGETLIREGEPSDGNVYFMISGRVAVTVNGRFILRLGRRGDIVGEMGLVGEELRSATVKTEAPSRFIVLSSAPSFLEGSDHTYRLRYYFTRMFTAILADKLRITSERAKLYEDAILSSRQVEAHNADLEERITHNVRQIRLFTHLVESANDAILIATLDGIVERANPAFVRIFGEDAGSVVGQPLARLLGLDPGGVRGWSAIADEARREGWSGEVEVHRDRKSVAIPADCMLSLVRTDRQAPLAFAVVLRDLRERKSFEARILRQQRELERAYTDLKTVDRLKDHFLTRVSHELRTPLTSVLGTLEMMTIPGMVDADQQPQFIDIMFREAKVLAARVDKLLAIAKIESGQMPFSFENADPVLVVEGALTQVRPMAQQKGLHVEFSPQGEFRRVYADSEQLGAALFEILENAIKFTDSGGVKVRLRQSHDDTLIEIEDSGRGLNGVSPDVLFDTLGQVREEPESTHGLGLGLPLSRLIVNAHSGTLGVDGAPGGGSLFWIRLPTSAVPGNDRPGDEVHS